MEWRNLECFAFGDSGELADELLVLVLEGKKRATCWAVAEGMKGAELGKSMVVLDGSGRPRAVLRTLELTIMATASAAPNDENRLGRL